MTTERIDYSVIETLRDKVNELEKQLKVAESDEVMWKDRLTAAQNNARYLRSSVQSHTAALRLLELQFIGATSIKLVK